MSARAPRTLGALAGVSAIALASGIAAADQEQYGEFEFGAKEIAIRAVEVENFLGDVRIEGHDRDVIAIRFLKRAPDAETLERLKVAFTPDPRGAVSIATSLAAGGEARPIAAGSIRIDLVIQVPRAARPRISVWKGEVELRGLDNGAEVSANEGDIGVTHVSGAISTKTAHGRHQFAELVGASIDASAVEGDMELDQVRGDRLRAVVHQGHVSGRRIHFREVTVRTTRGDIRIQAEVQSGGRYRLLSHRGDVELRLAGGRSARVLAQSARGRVSVGEGGQVEGEAGGVVTAIFGRPGRQSAQVLVRSVEGDVSLAVATW